MNDAIQTPGPVTPAVDAEMIPCAMFVSGRFGSGGLQGTPLEVWSNWLTQNHGTEAHTAAEWDAIIAAHARRPAWPDPASQQRRG